MTKANENVEAEHGHLGLEVADDAALFQPSSHPDAQWFANAGLGIFLHWGICSVRGMNISWPMIPGRALHATRIDDAAERERIIRERDWDLTGEPHHPTPSEYWAMAPEFNPDDYDPDQWCAAFKQAGFRYVVLTTKHHDGFAMWPSEYGDFNTENWMGGRDLVADFVAACRRHDLKIGLYFSGQDWYHDRDYRDFFYWQVHRTNPELGSLDADLNPRDRAGWTREEIKETSYIYPYPPKEWTQEQIDARYDRYRSFVRGQLEELLTRYGKIDIIWFDSAPPIPNRETTIVPKERIRELQPGIVINPRFYKGGDYRTFEGKFPDAAAVKGPWNELCNVWATNWTYVKDERYKPTAWAIEQLARCRALKMNYLVGIGPDRHGRLRPEAYSRMSELGRWLERHQDAVFDVEPLAAAETANVPATRRAGERFLFALRTFADGEFAEHMQPMADAMLTLSGITEPEGVTLMQDGSTPDWHYADGVLTVTLPTAKRSELGDAVCVSLGA